jgi:lipoprotein-releasing system permease protein
VGFELFIALRYLLAPRKQAFISVISLISTIGVAVGVTAVIVALALMTGLQGELRDRILGSMGHVYVWKTGGMEDYRAEVKKLLGVPGVLGAAPAVDGRALIFMGEAQAFISLKGIDPALEPMVTEIGTAMEQGSVTDLAPRTEDDFPGVLIGRQLAQNLGVKVGDVVNLITTQGTLSPAGPMLRRRPTRVAGVFSLGLLEFDTMYGFVSLEYATQLTGSEETRIQLRIEDVNAAPDIARDIEDRFGPEFVAQDWGDLNASLFSALWIEKMAVSIAISLIVVVAGLQIITSLILLVMEKSRDIGILKTMGTSPQRISAIFMLQGVVIGVVGTTVGAIGGLALCWFMDHYRLLRIPQDVYQIAYVPFVVRPVDFTTVIVSTIVVCFLATIYPSRQAARLDPVQALRFE